MEEGRRARFTVRVDKSKQFWSFGICFSHMFEETYLYINFLWWSISIGMLIDYDAPAEPYKGVE